MQKKHHTITPRACNKSIDQTIVSNFELLSLITREKMRRKYYSLSLFSFLSLSFYGSEQAKDNESHCGVVAVSILDSARRDDRREQY